MIVSGTNAAILCAEDAWQEFRKQQGIRDPFWDVKMKNFRAKCEKVVINGVECTQLHSDRPDLIKLEPGEVERYNDLHDKFMTAYIFATEGYETLCRTQYKILKDWFRPCEDPSGQCSLECIHYFEDCGKLDSERNYPAEFADIFNFIKKELRDEECQ